MIAVLAVLIALLPFDPLWIGAYVIYVMVISVFMYEFTLKQIIGVA